MDEQKCTLMYRSIDEFSSSEGQAFGRDFDVDSRAPILPSQAEGKNAAAMLKLLEEWWAAPAPAPPPPTAVWPETWKGESLGYAASRTTASQQRSTAVHQPAWQLPVPHGSSHGPRANAAQGLA
jgi:hypothetical protein